MAETDPSPLAACRQCKGVGYWGNAIVGFFDCDCPAAPRPQPTAAHGLADDLVWALKSALRFAASRAAITADEERGILAALRSSQPDTREGFAAGIDALVEARNLAAREVEGDSDNPFRVREANAIHEGLRDDSEIVQRHLEAHRAAKETTNAHHAA